MSDANSFKERNDFLLLHGDKAFDEKYGTNTVERLKDPLVKDNRKICPYCEGKLYRLKNEYNGKSYQCTRCYKYY